jgi:N-acetyl-anhydromuramyl-L-alanine amidase AmpD
MMINYVQINLQDNCWGVSRPDLMPEGIINHYISGIYADQIGLDNRNPFDVDLCIALLKYYKFSAHILIDREGVPYQLVHFSKQAYHAGISLFNGREDCNAWCFGIEHISTGEPYNGEPAFTEAQIETSRAVHRELMEVYNIPRHMVGSHRQIRQAAIDAGMKDRRGRVPPKKYDPGPHFPWGKILP